MKTTSILHIIVVMCTYCLSLLPLNCEASATRGGSSTTTTTTTTTTSRQTSTCVPRCPPEIKGKGRRRTGFVVRLPDQSASPSVEAKEDSEAAQGATIPNEVFNLVKCIVGAGVFSLPGGIAAFAGSPKVLLPTTLLIVTIGFLSAYGFALIGRVCSYTGAKSYRDAWAKSVSSRTSWIPNVSSLCVTFGSVVAFSIVLADMIPQLMESVGLVVTRNQALLSVTTLVLLPLCLMKHISSLAPFSLVGVIGLVYTAIAMTIRLFDGSYCEGGRFFQSVPLPPSFTSDWQILNPSVFILISMLSTAFMAHFNAPQLYLDLRNNTLPRYHTMVLISYAIAVAICIAIPCVGFLTFGKSCGPFVLTNYSTKDPLLSLGKAACVASLLFSYPLTFAGFREDVLNMVGGQKQTQRQYEKEELGGNLRNTMQSSNTTTISLLAVVTCLAYCLKDVGFVLALNGATAGNALTYLYPSFMFLQCARKQNLDPGAQREVPLAIGTAILGLLMGVIGTIQATTQ